MSKQLPVAINPSITPFEQCHFELIELPPEYRIHACCLDIVIETNHKLISSSVAYLLGISHEWCTTHIGGEDKYTKCRISQGFDRGFHGRYGTFTGITLEQLQMLWSKAKNNRSNKFKPILSELILTQVLPLFNQAHLQTSMEVMQPIELNPIDANQPLTMSSLEIAEMCEKRHSHVMTDIKTMLEQLEINSAKFSAQYKDKSGKTNPCFKLDKEMSLTLVTGYNVKLRHKIIKRWQELENQLAGVPQITAQPVTPTLPAPQVKVNASFLKLAVKQIDDMKLSPDSKQVLKAQLLHDQTGLPLELMLPVTTEQKLSPTQIADRLKVSPQAIGRIISLLGFRGKDDYCEGRLSKAQNGSKEVVQYFYTEQAVQLIKQTLEEKKQHEKTN